MKVSRSMGRGGGGENAPLSSPPPPLIQPNCILSRVVLPVITNKDGRATDSCCLASSVWCAEVLGGLFVCVSTTGVYTCGFDRVRQGGYIRIVYRPALGWFGSLYDITWYGDTCLP